MRLTVAVCTFVFAVVPCTDAVAQRAPDNASRSIVWPQQFTAPAQEGPTTRIRVATGISGAILGAALGFFASQVVRGDWQDETGSIAGNRGLWAAIGGATGFALGLRFPLGVGRPSVVHDGLPIGRARIRLEEFEGKGFDDAFEAVSLLRPEWLQIRGARSLAAGVDPLVVGGLGRVTVLSGTTPLTNEQSAIQVYVDEVRIGGLETLRTVNMMIVEGIYFFDTTQATARWGSGHPHGAILIVT